MLRISTVRFTLHSRFLCVVFQNFSAVVISILDFVIFSCRLLVNCCRKSENLVIQHRTQIMAKQETFASTIYRIAFRRVRFVIVNKIDGAFIVIFAVQQCWSVSPVYLYSNLPIIVESMRCGIITTMGFVNVLYAAFSLLYFQKLWKHIKPKEETQ